MGPTDIPLLADDQLIAAVKTLAEHEQHATVRLVTALAEMERRHLYRGQGYSSLYEYCVNVLNLSEDAAYTRAHVARMGVRYPVALEELATGAVSLTALRLLEPSLTAENHRELIAAIRHRSKRDVERFIARMSPESEIDPPARVTPIGADRYRIQFTASQELHDKLFHAQDLLRHAIPSGDLAAVLERAVDELLAKVERAGTVAASHGGSTRPTRAGSRVVPREVRRAVWRRDEGRCTFVGREGRCTATAFLELHHIVPFAEGGKSTVENLTVRCQSHNAYEAEVWFGSIGDPIGPSSRND